MIAPNNNFHNETCLKIPWKLHLLGKFRLGTFYKNMITCYETREHLTILS